MKIDRHSRSNQPTSVKHRGGRFLCGGLLAAASLAAVCVSSANTQSTAAHDLAADEVDAAAASAVSRGVDRADRRGGDGSQIQAVKLLRAVTDMLVNGPAFDAKFRETVWTTGRSVVGVGTYEQAGGGSGRYNLLVTMLDGHGKHRLQQISDGRLAWTRSEVAGTVTLRRVDVGLLEQRVEDEVGPSRISPRLKVGGWAEMLGVIERDYVLQALSATLHDEPVWVIKGKLREQLRQRLMASTGRKEWPELYPTQVRVAIKAQPDPSTGFGAYLPVRIEYLSDPVAAADDGSQAGPSPGRLISLIELYSIRPINPPPEQRFRFENRDSEVMFVDETDRYIQRYGIQLSERELRQLQR